MHVITRKRLNEFADEHPDALSALEHWYREMKTRRFANFALTHRDYDKGTWRKP